MTIVETVDQYRGSTYADIPASLLAIAFEPPEELDQLVYKTHTGKTGDYNLEDIEAARDIGRTLRRLTLRRRIMMTLGYSVLGAAIGYSAAQISIDTQNNDSIPTGYTKPVDIPYNNLITTETLTAGFAIAGAILGGSFNNRLRYAQARASQIVDQQLETAPGPQAICSLPLSNPQIVWSSNETAQTFLTKNNASRT